MAEIVNYPHPPPTPPLTGVGILQVRGRGVVKSVNGGGRERTPTMKVNRQTF
ncbi:unknown protein [Microcystis aeruginosa NIES-843]|uniref:Uncharacterized protein n=1 Tax=Microcystis aeruginosa (strain NIES-843 / IAM M-2473) TaxID=449447 RepID=B0JP10_MICAN|nr:unknown protein [Microcystis aeruginosa NIES-843]BAG01484.1 unknown protein [Microcystis aeruginosa NIES-843]